MRGSRASFWTRCTTVCRVFCVSVAPSRFPSMDTSILALASAVGGEPHGLGMCAAYTTQIMRGSAGHRNDEGPESGGVGGDRRGLDCTGKKRRICASERAVKPKRSARPFFTIRCGSKQPFPVTPTRKGRIQALHITTGASHGDDVSSADSRDRNIPRRGPAQTHTPPEAGLPRREGLPRPRARGRRRMAVGRQRPGRDRPVPQHQWIPEPLLPGLRAAGQALRDRQPLLWQISV
jgi:hypothetical protein